MPDHRSREYVRERLLRLEWCVPPKDDPFSYHLRFCSSCHVVTGDTSVVMLCAAAEELVHEAFRPSDAASWPEGTER